MIKLLLGSKTPKNKILDSEFSREVEETGKTVKESKVGEQVSVCFGQTMSANAEYLHVP